MLPPEAKSEDDDKPAAEPTVESKRTGRPLRVTNPRGPEEVMKALAREPEKLAPKRTPGKS